MTTINPNSTSANAETQFDELVKKIRPELHRYCANMVGSVIDGEDVLQDALTRAYQSLPSIENPENLHGWLFRIAHNKAIDRLRRYEYKYVDNLDDDDALSTEDKPLENAENVNLAMQLFLELTPKQRACVLLKDVMSYSLAEISEILEMNITSVKAALHRGRVRLRVLSPGFARKRPPIDGDTPHSRFLKKYVDTFNARDFDTLRALLAEDVRCDLVGLDEFKGAGRVSGYYGNYDSKDDWRLAFGYIDAQPTILVYDPRTESQKPVYFMVLETQDSKIKFIRDFRYARYVMEYAEVFEE